MDERYKVLIELREYIENVDKEATLLLQNLQWDPKHFTQITTMTVCKYDSSHKIPVASKEAHEEQCYLKNEGYSKEDVLLPDPVDPAANTVVRLSKHDIKNIINKESSSNPSFKKGSEGAEPLSVERLQQVYSSDERRAIHDAVVKAAPFCHDLTDLALPSANNEAQGKTKSRMEILAELRDMKRRRAKYRVAAKTSNYSHVLKDVIKTQMELYAEAKGIFIKTEYGPKSYITLNSSSEICTEMTNVVIKQERMSPETDKTCEYGRHTERNRDSSDKQGKRQHHREKERDTYEFKQKSRDHYDPKHKSRDQYEPRHISSTDRRDHNDFRSNRHSTRDRRQYDYQSKSDRFVKQEEDAQNGSNHNNSPKVSYRYSSDYKRKMDGDLGADRSKYSRGMKEYDKHSSYREGRESRDNGSSKSRAYRKYNDNIVDKWNTEKRSKDHAFDRYRETASSSKKRRYEE